jgi:hypothetical protein
MRPVGADGAAQRSTLGKQMALADEFIELPRSHTLRQRWKRW